MPHWLMKSEPDTFAIADLARVGVEPWTGVRSLFARNFMRAMAVGDDVLFYHSSVAPPGVAGLARVVRTGVIDETQFDPTSEYFDARATREAPRWDCVDVEFVATLPRLVTLDELRGEPALRDMMLFKWGRLSVQPVTPAQFARIVELAGQPAPEPRVKPRLAAKARAQVNAKPKEKSKAKAKPRAKRTAAPRARQAGRRRSARR